MQAQLEPMEPLMEEEELPPPDRTTSASFTSRTGAGDSAPIAPPDGAAGLPRSSASSAVSAAFPLGGPPAPSIVSMDAASGALASTGHADAPGIAASIGAPVSEAGAARRPCSRRCARAAPPSPCPRLGHSHDVAVLRARAACSWTEIPSVL